MKKYFLYHLRKRLPVFVTFTIILFVIYFFYTVNFKWESYNYGYSNALTIIYPITIGLLAVVVPVIEFTFKMKKITTIHLYSLPLKKSKLYLIRYLVGYLEIAIPFTICYFLSLIVIAASPNNLVFGFFFLYYPAMLIAVFLVYSFYSFVYSRCNILIDGIISMILSTTSTILIAASITKICGSEAYSALWSSFNWSAIQPLALVEIIFTRLLNYNIRPFELDLNILSGIIFCFVDLAMCLLFMILNGDNKAESAAQSSDSWFSYKVLIPLAGLPFAFLNLLAFGGFLSIALTIIFTYLEYALYLRTFKLNEKYWIVFAIVASLEIIVFLGGMS